MRTSDIIAEKLEELAIKKYDKMFYWKDLYKNTKDKNKKKYAKKMSDIFYDEACLICDIISYIYGEIDL